MQDTVQALPPGELGTGEAGKPEFEQPQFEKSGFTAWLLHFLAANPALIILAVLMVAGAFLSPVFLTTQNLLNILWTVSVLGIVAMGQTILLITGNFDMSVAYVVGLAGITAVIAQLWGAGFLVSVLVGLAAGALIGLLNGTIIVWTKANAFLITLGTSILVYSINLILTQSKTWYASVDSFLLLGRGKLFDTVHYSVIIFLLLGVLLQLMLRYTTFGRSLYIIGSNQRAGALSGIRINRIKLATYIFCGTTAALAGLIMTARTGSTVANAGVGMDFDSLIAAVLGGTSLFGGRGGTLRTIVGVLILGVLNNLLVLLNVPYEAQQIAKGLVFLSVVWMDGFLQKR
jgi:ribose/xylose/arabinose/galactoside ABC-type transport system permease subunit